MYGVRGTYEEVIRGTYDKGVWRVWYIFEGHCFLVVMRYRGIGGI